MEGFVSDIKKAEDQSENQAQVLPRLSIIPSVILILLVVTCSVYLSIYRNKLFAAAIIIAISLFIIFVVRSFKIFVIIAIPCVFVLGLSGSFVPLAVTLSVVVIIGLGAFIINLIRSPLLLFAVPIVYVVSVFLSGDFRLALFSVICFVPATIHAISFSMGKSRVSTVLRTSISIAVPLIFCFILWVFIKYQSFGINTLSDIIENTNTRLTEYLSKLYLTSGEEKIYIFEKDGVKSAASLIMNIIPAIFIVCCNIAAFFADALLISLYKTNKLISQVSEEAKRFSLSTVTAVVFIAAYIVLLLLSDDNGTLFWAVVAENIYLILIFPLTYVGAIATMKKIMSLQKRRKGIIILVFVGIFVFTPLIIIIGAYIGVFYTILNNRRLRKLSK